MEYNDRQRVGDHFTGGILSLVVLVIFMVFVSVGKSGTDGWRCYNDKCIEGSVCIENLCVDAEKAKELVCTK